MDSVRVRIDDFAEQKLPKLCAVTGQPADVWASGRAERRPSGLWFFLVGWWVFFLPTTRVDGWIPMTSDAIARLKRNRLVCWAAAFCTGLLAWAAFSGGLLEVAVIAGLATLPSLFFAANTPGSVGARLESDPRWVVLEPVHPRFADACRAAVD